MAGQRFRRLTDLFVNGSAVQMPDDTYLWVQAINAYERDEAISDAQIARARMTMALKEHGSERIKVEARLERLGRDAFIDDLATAKADAKYSDIVAAVEDDPEWSERVAILRRYDPDNAAAPSSEEEEQLIGVLAGDWQAEVDRRVRDEKEWQVHYYTRGSDEQLLDDYLDMWLEKKGTQRANAEYQLTEMWYATRYCDAVPTDGELDHTRCEGHAHRVFDTKADARAVPDGLKSLLMVAITELGMNNRDPKGSANPPNSSASSPPPNEAEESQPSTSTETLVPLPGT